MIINYVLPIILFVIEGCLYLKARNKYQLFFIPILLVIITVIIAVNDYLNVTTIVTSAPIIVHILMNVWVYLLALLASILLITKSRHKR